ncbi:MAG: HlyC/CorC family transporter [Flavobacteriales bacterium]|jgi:putative hemolysin|nr:HlyC/CorC family transporter [Flavobacteriales bacterium]MBK9515261.1 HlyC/CorC family transporter [Flavobacteriales bacterium]MBP7450376.1 HlyC/CorC family transporter [Flavobacteriales bacterium]HOZ40570.1 hemolysin family protein [Flavobacteriales bacterium]
MEVLIIFLLTLLNGFFSLSEIALVSVKRTRIQTLADRGNRNARTVLKLLDDPEAFLSSVQVGITLIGIISGAYGGAALTDDMELFLSRWPSLIPYTHTIALALVIGSITYFTIVVGELVPKTIALSNPEGIALTSGPIIRVFSLVTYPIVKLLSVSTSLIMKLLPVKESQGDRLSEEELRAMIRTANTQGLLDMQETEAHQNLFRFSEQVARTLMTHRSEVEWVDSTRPVSELIAQVKDSTRSKFPVCRGSVDEIEGTLNIRDLLEKLSMPDFNLSMVVRQPVIIPENTSAYNILKLFKKNKQYIALVVDEHGQFEGVLTLHDLTEAIVGDLPDEDDAEEQEIVLRADGSWLVGGQVLIGDLNQRIGVDIIDERETTYATVAGYFLGRFEHIPKPGERLVDERFHGEVVDMDGHRIDKVLITLKEE